MYLPSGEMLPLWQTIAPRKIFFLHGTGNKVSVASLAQSETLMELFNFGPHTNFQTYGLDWFAEEVRQTSAGSFSTRV
jgi:hypothetical protein